MTAFALGAFTTLMSAAKMTGFVDRVVTPVVCVSQRSVFVVRAFTPMGVLFRELSL